jgi:aminopeptidase N
MHRERVQSLSKLCTILALAGCSAPAQRIGAVRAPAEVAHTPRTAPFDVEHYALDIALDPTARSIAATCRVRLWSRVDGLEHVELDLERLTVRAVHDSDGRELEFAQRGGTLRIEPEHALRRGEDLELCIEYGGKPAKGLWFSDEHAGVATQVFTQGECEDARWWFPCFDEPSDRATSEVRVELPRGWTSLAAGERVDHGELASGRTFETWRMSTPHPPYLTTLVAGELTTDVDVWDGIPLIAVADPIYTDELKGSFAETAQVLAVFSDLTGARYPYAKYAQACVENFPFGGMENISATTLTDTMLGDEFAQRDGGAHGLIAHEAAHQWFGDLLTCNDWSHVWLNESFATYFALLYDEATRGVDAFRAGVRDMRDGYLAQDVGDNRRPMVWNVYREPMDLFFGGQTYPGGASRLHYLRFVLGDDAFFRGIRRYVADNRGRGVVTHDFQVAMEAASGVELGSFFEQWFATPGYPEFQTQWKYDASAHVVRLNVQQVQVPSGATPEAFHCAAEVEVRDSGGSRTERVAIERRAQTIELAADTEPKWVVFDPHGWLVARIESTREPAEWSAMLAEHGDVNCRRDAARALGELLAQPGDDATRWVFAEALMHAMASDECAAVRAAAASAFSTIHVAADHAIARALMQCASNDGEPDVRVSALQTLARFGASAELAQFGREQFDARFSWNTMGAAAALAVMAEPETAHAWLDTKLDLPSPHGVLRASLLGSLALLAGDEVTAELRRRAVDASTEPAAREVAVRSLARRCKHDADVRRELAAMLASTDQYSLQSALIDALAEIGDGAALEALTTFYESCVDVRQKRAIEKALRSAAD